MLRVAGRLPATAVLSIKNHLQTSQSISAARRNDSKSTLEYITRVHDSSRRQTDEADQKRFEDMTGVREFPVGKFADVWLCECGFAAEAPALTAAIPAFRSFALSTSVCLARSRAARRWRPSWRWRNGFLRSPSSQSMRIDSSCLARSRILTMPWVSSRS